MEMQNVILKIYTDGAYSPKDKCGGWSIVVQAFTDDGFKQYKFSGGEHGSSNNRMELTAAIKALSFARQFTIKAKHPRNTSVFIISDSAYVVNAVNNAWITKWKMLHWFKVDGEPVKNKELWVEFDKLLSSVEASGTFIEFIHVRGHAGDPGNELADELAVAARKKIANS